MEAILACHPALSTGLGGKFVRTMPSTTEFFVFQQVFSTRSFDPETRAFFGSKRRIESKLLEDEELCCWMQSQRECLWELWHNRTGHMKICPHRKHDIEYLTIQNCSASSFQLRNSTRNMSVTNRPACRLLGLDHPESKLHFAVLCSIRHASLPIFGEDRTARDERGHHNLKKLLEWATWMWTWKCCSRVRSAALAVLKPSRDEEIVHVTNRRAASGVTDGAVKAAVASRGQLLCKSVISVTRPIRCSLHKGCCFFWRYTASLVAPIASSSDFHSAD